MENGSPPSNYTKLNLDSLNAPSLPEFGSTPLPQSMTVNPTSEPSRKLGFNTVFLVVSVLVFVFSASYYVQTTRINSSSRADTTMNNMGGDMQMSKQTVDTLPSSYNGKDIDPAVVASLKKEAARLNAGQKQVYIKDRLIKYYIYADVIAENHLELPAQASDAVTEDRILAMENLIRTELVSNADFTYIYAKFHILAKEEELKKTYGNLDDRAKAVIGRYQQLFIDPTYQIPQILDVANKDEELLALTDGDKMKMITGYNGNQSVFTLDPGFQTFLFSLKENQLSDIYTLKTDSDVPYGYAVVFPTKIEKKKYDSLSEILAERRLNFN